MKLNVGYYRLSQKDRDNENEYSESIYNQQVIVENYAKEHGIKLDKCYIDDGYSGGNFERPGIQELLNDIENNQIGLIITKDMSRLGRNFIETGYYIERYFTKYNVRYIAINDFYDSDDKDSKLNDVMVGIKSIINDTYIKDMSKKIKKAKDKLKLDGYYIGGADPYGYKITKENGHSKLIIDEKVAPVVRFIFEEKAKDVNPNIIADELNKKGIDTPYHYFNPNGTKDYENIWDYKKIYRIIRNVLYEGCLFYRAKYKEDVHSKKISVVPLHERKIIENTHEGIVSKELFAKANSNITKSTNRVKANYNGIYKNLVICGECGKPMKFHSRVRSKQDFIIKCTTQINTNRCHTATLLESKLDKIVKDILNKLIEEGVSEKDVIEGKIKQDYNIYSSKNNLNSLINKNKLIDDSIKELYLKKCKNIISDEEYNLTLDKLKEEKNSNTAIIDKLKGIVDVEKQKDTLLEEYRKMLGDEELLNKNIDKFIDRIIFYKDRTIKINFKFKEKSNEIIKLY